MLPRSYYPVHFMVAAQLLLGTVALVVPTPPSQRFAVERQGRLPIKQLLWQMLLSVCARCRPGKPVTELQPMYVSVGDDEEAAVVAVAPPVSDSVNNDVQKEGGTSQPRVRRWVIVVSCLCECHPHSRVLRVQ